MRALAGLVVMALVLVGCSHPSSTTYEAADVGRTIETAPGTVVSSRRIKVAGDTNMAGPLGGGALGASGAALAFQGSGLVAVIGGVIGAGLGYLAQQQMSHREGVEYVLEMDDGRTVTLAQNRQSDQEEPFPNGTPVLVQVTGQYTRVIADPRAERVGPGIWVDPDALSSEEIAPTVSDVPIGTARDPEPLEEPLGGFEQQ
jgi:outer membrane lipoprotein SlyB